MFLIFTSRWPYCSLNSNSNGFGFIRLLLGEILVFYFYDLFIILTAISIVLSFFL